MLHQRSSSILLVDDEVEMCLSLSDVLTSKGYSTSFRRTYYVSRRYNRWLKAIKELQTPAFVSHHRCT